MAFSVEDCKSSTLSSLAAVAFAADICKPIDALLPFHVLSLNFPELLRQAMKVTRSAWKPLAFWSCYAFCDEFFQRELENLWCNGEWVGNSQSRIKCSIAASSKGRSISCCHFMLESKTASKILTQRWMIMISPPPKWLPLIVV